MSFKKIISLITVLLVVSACLLGCNIKKEAKINSKSDLSGKRIGVQEGTTGDNLVTEQYKDAKISRFKKAVDAAIDLKNGKLDAVVLDAMPAKKIVEKNKDLIILPEELSKEEYAIAVKKGNTELLNSINKTLDKIKNDGKYNSFLNAFMPDEGKDKAKLPERVKKDATKTLVMGTNAEFEPFEYRENEKIIGFDIEIANEIASDMGANLKIEDMAFDSLIQALSGGKVDMVVAGMTVTDERKQNVDFSNPYFNASQVIIVKK